MNPQTALALLSSPTGAKGGGASVPNLNQQEAKSGASLDASGSSFNLSSGTAADFIVGGQKNNTWVLLLAVGAVAIFLLRK